MAMEEPIEGSQREVTQMLMINGIKLTTVNHLLDVRHFDDGDTVVLQNLTYVAHEPVQIRHVRQHVIGVYYVGAVTFQEKTLDEILAKKVANGRNASLLLSDPGNVNS